MNIDNVRINITLPKELIQLVDSISGPRKRSSFIADAIRFKIGQDRKAEIEKQLAEGYRACNAESLDMVAEFNVIDLEGWDDQY